MSFKTQSITIKGQQQYWKTLFTMSIRPNVKKLFDAYYNTALITGCGYI